MFPVLKRILCGGKLFLNFCRKIRMFKFRNNYFHYCLFIILSSYILTIPVAFFQSKKLSTNIETIRIKISPLNTEIKAFRGFDEDSIELIPRNRYSGEWEDKDKFYRRLLLSFTANSIDVLKSVEITIGKKKIIFDSEAFLKTWIKVGGNGLEDKHVYASPYYLNSGRFQMLGFPDIINWDINPSLLRKVFSRLICLFFILFLSSLPLFKSISKRTRVIKCSLIKYFRKDRFTFNKPLPVHPNYSHKSAIFIGFLFLVCCLTYLEITDTFYFTEDDNFVQFLPNILQGCRSLFEEGRFPTLNPYQRGGCPTSSLGIYALTYPLTYLSYFISKFILSNEYYTIEVFAIIHLVLGYFSSLWLFRTIGIRRPMLCVVASLSFILSGYNLIVGRSWYYMLPVVLWVPLLLVSLAKFQQNKVNWKWILFTGVGIGVFFHAGNAQMWIYTMMFFILFLGILFILERKYREKIYHVICAFCLGIAVALPLLITTFLATKDLFRGGKGRGIINGILAMVFPYPIVQAPHPNTWFWCNDHNEVVGQIYYSGTVFIVVAFYGIFLFFIKLSMCKQRRLIKEIILDNIWIIMSIVAFLFALGNKGGLWTIFLRLPVFNKFSHPFKFLSFVNLFFIIVGILIIERYFTKRKINRKFQNALYGLVLILIFYHITLCKAAFFSYTDKPYPQLPKDLQASLTSEGKDYPQRIYVSSHYKSLDSNYVFCLQHNFPSVYKVLSVLGYENLLPTLSLSNNKLNQYGVKYILLSMAKEDPRNKTSTTTPFPDNIKFRKISKFEKVILFEMEEYMPLAFLEKKPDVSFPIKFTGQGAVVDLSSLKGPSNVVVNMFYRENMVATIDGRPLKIKPDEWDRIVVLNISPGRTLEIKYIPPWRTGVFFAILILSIVGIIYWYNELRNQNLKIKFKSSSYSVR